MLDDAWVPQRVNYFLGYVFSAGQIYDFDIFFIHFIGKEKYAKIR